MRNIASALRRVTDRLRRDESGQDIIEYGLIAGIIALTSLIMFVVVAPKMGVAYVDWNDAQEAAWEPCDPILLGGCP